MIKYLESNNFDKEIENKRILVDFYADWCGPCKMMGKVLEKMENIEILKVNVDKFPELSQKYGVMSIPNLILFEKGNPLKNHVGFIDESELNNFINDKNI